MLTVPSPPVRTICKNWLSFYGKAKWCTWHHVLTRFQKPISSHTCICSQLSWNTSTCIWLSTLTQCAINTARTCLKKHTFATSMVTNISQQLHVFSQLHVLLLYSMKNSKIKKCITSHAKPSFACTCTSKSLPTTRLLYYSTCTSYMSRHILTQWKFMT